MTLCLRPLFSTATAIKWSGAPGAEMKVRYGKGGKGQSMTMREFWKY